MREFDPSASDKEGGMRKFASFQFSVFSGRISSRAWLGEMRRELRMIDWALGNLRGCWMTGCEEPSRAYMDGIRRRELVRRYLAPDSATRVPGGLTQ
jgi:hypothetical protein